MSSRVTRDPCTYFIRTFGCQMNLHDSEHIEGVLEAAGFSRAPGPASAGLLVFNTCSVRGSAEDKVWGKLAALVRKQDGLPLVAVCGCMAERLGGALLAKAPAVDLVFGLDSLPSLPALVDRCRDERLCDTGDIDRAAPDGLPARRLSVARAWVPVSHGCDNRCAYCVVPLVRGAERSRSAEEIVEEVTRLAGEGVIEVTLLGQNVNSYGRDLDRPNAFAGLLEMVAAVPGIRRVKFETSHPRDLGDDVIQAMAAVPELCEHLHLPVQAGSDAVLQAMGRGYGRDFYMERVGAAREAVDGLVVTTDLMVGFPGESEADFDRTLDLVARVRFDSAYLFKYSRREGTRAAEMEGEAEADVKSSRFDRLAALQETITEASLRALVGRRVEVLVEGRARRGAFMMGRTRGNQVVLLPQDEVQANTLVEAEVGSAGRHAVRGKPVTLLHAAGGR